LAVEEWIRDLVPGKDFADVGGLWGGVNEKVGCAAKAHARSVTMIDITESSDDLWQQFRDRCAALGVTGCQCISSDINSDATLALGQRFDVLHCSGLLYHGASPLQMLVRLRHLCRGTLLLGTTVIPPYVQSRSGTLACEPGGALFVPALVSRQRQIAADYFREVGAATMIGLDMPARWGHLDYDPWWWLFTVEHVHALIEVAGFVVRDNWTTWSGRAAYFRADAH
jgi:hypothetical protein